ncbi:MAG: efflux RND transporter permease subunit [Nitrospiraceae bacterium]
MTSERRDQPPLFISRFCVEHRATAWVLLLATLLWGVFGFLHMPKRKDPDTPVRIAVAICPWEGVPAEKVEQLVTRKLEETIAGNSKVAKIESTTRDSVAIVHVELHEKVLDTGKEFDDIQLKLNGIHDLPEGAGPITFLKDYGETAALMLTVASPKLSEIEVELRARAIAQAIERTRAGAPAGVHRTTVIMAFPQTVSAAMFRRPAELFARLVEQEGLVRDGRMVEGPGFIGLDGVARSEAAILTAAHRFIQERLTVSEIHPDAWDIVVVAKLEELPAKLKVAAGAKYTYRELDDLTALIKRTLQTVPQVSKVTRAGVLQEQIVLTFSQERLASYGLQLSLLPGLLAGRNITLPSGQLEIEGKRLIITPSGEFKSEQEIQDVLIPTAPREVPLYLRDLVDLARGYETPPRYLNFYSWRDSRGTWHRSRAITLAVQMRPGEQIGEFGAAVDAALATLKEHLPEDLVIAKTSDQPLQVAENMGLFLKTLYEAVLLVVLVALIGFWDWRAACLIAASIPITLALTFALMAPLGLDIQQVSLATLVIALGLLVDMPVVAGDAINHELAAGHAPVVAAWLGPTRLAKAIFFATLTNIVAYLPFLMLSGDTGRFLFSLPVVMTLTLSAAYVVSLTFIPLLSYYLVRPKDPAALLAESQGAAGMRRFYARTVRFALDHRWAVFCASLGFLTLGAGFIAQLKPQFFPKDLSYLSYVDVWLPGDAPLSATSDAVAQAEAVIREVAEEYGARATHPDGSPRQVLASLTSFVGGGGPRFWFSVAPEQQQLNYAQIMIQVTDKHDTEPLIAPLQDALTERIPGARLDVRQLETGKPVGIPVAVRLSGEDIATLRTLANRVKAVFRANPQTARIRDSWGDESFVVRLRIDPDRANLAGVSNRDVATSAAAALYGVHLTDLREGDKQIQVVARLRTEERAQLSDVQNLYVYSFRGKEKVPLRQVSSVEYGLETQKLLRRHQFRTITVSCFPAAGVLPSEVIAAVRPALREAERSFPPGYKLEIGGEEEEQVKGFRELALVLAVSVGAIFVALVLQFNHVVKPWLVFAAVPYGMVGGLLALRVMGAPFGFMAFLGIASLVGVIVSHIIVLFDRIEESRVQGKPLRESLVEAGVARMRPVLVTVGATVFGLIPLALHGGPLWQPLCYAQIGGLTVATFITLVLVPVLYSVAVLDLKVIRWEGSTREE